jgi:ABC-type transport system substrate-binding protein
LFLCWGLAGCDTDPYPKANPGRQLPKTTFRALPDEPRSLDPHVDYDMIGAAVVALVYEGLLEYHPFKTDPYELRPCIAKSMPRRSLHSDGTETYTFEIKPGIRFHDDPCFPGGRGRELVAEDLVYSFKRIVDPKAECPASAFFQANVVGMAEAYERARKAEAFDYQAPWAGAISLDRYTFQLVLKKPNPQILYWLAMQFTAPVPREAVEFYDGKVHEGVPRDSFKFHPVGTGPFRLAEWTRRSYLRLVRNEHYNATAFPEGGWPAADEGKLRRYAGAALPMIDEVHFSIIREAIPYWVLFKQGYLDSYTVSRDVFHSVLSQSQSLTPEYASRGVQLTKLVDPSTFYFLFDMEDPLVGGNPRLRQALAAVYDESLANQIFSNGTDVCAQQLLPPGVFGHDPKALHPYRLQNVEKARALLAEAGYPNGIDPKTGSPLEIMLAVTGDSAGARQKAEFDKRQLEQLGIRVEINEYTWEKYQEALDRGSFQMAPTAWVLNCPDPENFLMLFYSKNIPPAGSNQSRYRNAEFDSLYEKMRAMENTPERLSIIQRMNEILAEDCPFIPLFHNVAYGLNQPWVPRLESNMFLNNVPKYLDLDVKLRQAKIAEWNRRNYLPLWAGLGVLGFCAVYAFNWARRHYV